MTKKKSEKTKQMFSLTLYLQRQDEKKHAKKHHREEKRDAKSGKPHVH